MVGIVILAVIVAALLLAGLVFLIVWICNKAKREGANSRVAKHNSTWWKSFIASYIVTDHMLNKRNKKK